MLLSIIVIGFIILWRKTNWKAVEKENERYYIDGYHIYYDRKIIQQMESKSSQIHSNP